ncbi:MAG: hypothetical protein ABSF24_08685 [Candidatus Bathyarchaeia archaeon]|jgi:hypothetical protein
MSGKKPWVAKKDEICNKEFEETRRCLLISYHSYVQNHAGYLIAIMIGSVVLISSWNNFFMNISSEVIFSLLLIVPIGCVFVYMVWRTFYWTSYATGAIHMSLEDAIPLFNEANSKSKVPYLEEDPAPYTAILQMAIWQRRKKNKKPLYKRLLRLVIVPIMNFPA